MACEDGIRIYVFSYPGLAFFYIMSYYFQAIKKQRLAAVMTALEGLAFPVGFMAVLAPLFKMTGVWATCFERRLILNNLSCGDLERKGIKKL